MFNDISGDGGWSATGLSGANEIESARLVQFRVTGESHKKGEHKL